MRHKIFRLLTLLALGWMGAACSSEKLQEPPAPPENIANTVLMIQAALADGTRSETKVPDREKLHSLRTIILDSKDNVEVNDYIDFGTNPILSCYRIFELTGGKKTIYFIANEEGCGENISNILSPFDKEAIENYSFTAIDDKPIPASSKYEIELTEADKGKRVEKEMYLVRASTKFSFRFKNYRISDVTVNSINISSLADNMFLMPHVKDENINMSWEGTELYWIDWLKKVVEESQANLQYPSSLDPDMAERHGWLTEYEIPDGVIHTSRTISLDEFIVPAKMTESEQPKETDEFYFNESRYPTSSADAGSANSTQSYTMSFNLTENGKPVPQQTVKFNNLKALFRNTHVLVDVEFGAEIFVKVIPYAECWLNPIFGLDLENNND